MVQANADKRIPGEASDEELRESEVSTPPSETSSNDNTDKENNTPAEIPNDDQTPQPQPERAM